MIPKSYDEWKQCITVKCEIPLTSQFIARRLAVYYDTSNAETKRFINLYGQAHYDNIILWYNRAAAEISF